MEPQLYLCYRRGRDKPPLVDIRSAHYTCLFLLYTDYSQLALVFWIVVWSECGGRMGRNYPRPDTRFFDDAPTRIAVLRSKPRSQRASWPIDAPHRSCRTICLPWLTSVSLWRTRCATVTRFWLLSLPPLFFHSGLALSTDRKIVCLIPGTLFSCSLNWDFLETRSSETAVTPALLGLWPLSHLPIQHLSTSPAQNAY